MACIEAVESIIKYCQQSFYI